MKIHKITKPRAALLLLMIMLSGCEKSESDDVGFAGGVIQEQLKSPSSYQLIRGKTVWKGLSKDEEARVVMVEYDAQNGFGALIRGCSYVAFIHDKNTGKARFFPGRATTNCDYWPSEEITIDRLKRFNF